MKNYTLIGSGRLATHLQFYFSNLKVPLRHWDRRASPAALHDMLASTDVVLLAISDQALSDWISRHELCDKVLVHFAGARHFENAWGFHPLMTFSHHLYPAEFYPGIPFVTDPAFPYRDIFPFLENPVYTLAAEKRPLYHALCNMAANFPALLWVHLFSEFEKNLSLPREILEPMIRQVTSNTFAEGAGALAGPLRRGDLDTLEMHEQALQAHPSLWDIHRAWMQWATSFPIPGEKT